MPRTYTKLDSARWDEAAELHARGLTQTEIADKLGVSPRSVNTNLPAALERRRLALAASTGGTAATAPIPGIALAALPDVADREASTRHWRQAAWADVNALQAKLRALTSEPAPDQRAIRSLQAAAGALRDLIKIGSELVGADRHAADEELPELVVRELTDSEVAAIRQSQREKASGLGDLDDADRLALNLDDDDGGDAEGHAVVVEGCDEVSGA